MEVNASRRRHRGVQLAHRARAEVPRVLILCLCLRQFRIDALKIRVAHQGFAAEQKFPLERDAERHIAKRPHGSCHEFADIAVAARHRLIERAVPVAQYYREAVHLPREQGLLRSEPGNQLVHALGFVEREHGLLMGYLGERGQHFIAHALRRGTREHNAALLFEALQFVIGAVVLEVTHNFAALLIVGARRRKQGINQGLHLFSQFFFFHDPASFPRLLKYAFCRAS